MAQKLKKSDKALYRSTFTFFIPSPPKRKSGYREREFDKIMRGLFDSGLELESLQTSSTGEGLYVIAILKTSTKRIHLVDKEQDIQEKFKLSDTHPSGEIILDEA